MFHPMKAETIERRKKEREIKTRQQSENLLARLKEKGQNDPIFQELYEEHKKRINQ